MEKRIIRQIIRESIDELLGEGCIDEMAYPENFNIEEFKNIKSFAGKVKYAQLHLLGKVGAGSSRAVFKIDDEKVIKIAMNKKGLAQNLSESEGFKQNYDILARVFDIDQDDMWIEMELAKKITFPKRFEQLVGTTVQELEQWLRSKRGLVMWGKFTDLGENEFAEDLWNFIEDYDYPVPGDFGRLSSYGEVLRDGKPTVVVIDFGFDKNTSGEHEKKKKMRYAY